MTTLEGLVPSWPCVAHRLWGPGDPGQMRGRFQETRDAETKYVGIRRYPECWLSGWVMLGIAADL